MNSQSRSRLFSLYPLQILLQVLLRARQPQWCALVVNTQTLKVLLKVHFFGKTVIIILYNTVL